MKKYLILTLSAILIIPSLFSQSSKYFREVETVSEPIYLKRSGTQWKTMGRIVGEIKNAPSKYTIEIYRQGQSSRPMRAEEHDGDIHVYETFWLEPGQYTMVLKSSDTTTYRVKKPIIIKAGFDCLVNITFGTEEFRRKR